MKPYVQTVAAILLIVLPMLASSQTPAGSAVSRSPVGVCRARTIESGYLSLYQDGDAKRDKELDQAEADGSAQQAVKGGDGSIERSVNGGDVDDSMETARCLVHFSYLVEARQLLLQTFRDYHHHVASYSTATRREIADRLAIVEEKLGLHAAAVAHINFACPSCDSSDLVLGADSSIEDADIVKDFHRIAKLQLRISAIQVQKRSKEYWDTLTTDERQVVVGHGGTRANGDGYPCHTEYYDASGYHEEVWWYGCNEGGYAGGYTFVNGNLTSTYSP